MQLQDCYNPGFIDCLNTIKSPDAPGIDGTQDVTEIPIRQMIRDLGFTIVESHQRPYWYSDELHQIFCHRRFFVNPDDPETRQNFDLAKQLGTAYHNASASYEPAY